MNKMEYMQLCQGEGFLYEGSTMCVWVAKALLSVLGLGKYICMWAQERCMHMLGFEALVLHPSFMLSHSLAHEEILQGRSFKGGPFKGSMIPAARVVVCHLQQPPKSLLS